MIKLIGKYAYPHMVYGVDVMTERLTFDTEEYILPNLAVERTNPFPNATMYICSTPNKADYFSRVFLEPDLKNTCLDKSLGNPWDTGKADPIADIKSAKECVMNMRYEPLGGAELDRLKRYEETIDWLWNQASIEERNQFGMDILFDDDNNYILDNDDDL